MRYLAIVRTFSKCVLSLLLFAVGADLQANTRFGYGTIVAVDADGSTSRMKAPHYTVLYEFRNLAWTNLFYRESYKFREKTRHGERVYFLDGEPSTPDAALKVGRAICHTANDMVIYVSTQPGPFVPEQRGNFASGLARLSLQGALKLNAAKVDGEKVGAMEALGGTVILLLDCDEDAIRGMAVLGAFSSNSDAVADCSKLTREPGKLSGEVTIRLQLRSEASESNKGGAGYKLESGDVVEIVVSLDASGDDKGQVVGTFKGKCNGSEIVGKLAGEIEPRAVKLERARVWMQLQNMPYIGKGYLVLPFEAGQATAGGRILFSKGDQRGELEQQELRREGNRLHGRLTGKMSGQGGTVVFEIDATILGERLFSGSCRMEADGKQHLYMVRGGFCSADGPQMQGPSKEQSAVVKELQSKLTSQ